MRGASLERLTFLVGRAGTTSLVADPKTLVAKETAEEKVPVSVREDKTEVALGREEVAMIAVVADSVELTDEVGEGAPLYGLRGEGGKVSKRRARRGRKEGDGPNVAGGVKQDRIHYLDNSVPIAMGGRGEGVGQLSGSRKGRGGRKEETNERRMLFLTMRAVV
ncbi:hypothetical protein BCR35DRAFT_127887 [Leucosporidium creatinivorum]|uniref:Uncharacterized protein n=1 Tax=Leucosporidium creatinivorum TaxID=106004 RepID=A0A1Y2EWU3_9BASI|nr:hypothetical protein BCR35DRAFT_127887 [Leucosporidium creatinivorum]